MAFHSHSLSLDQSFFSVARTYSLLKKLHRRVWYGPSDAFPCSEKEEVVEVTQELTVLSISLDTVTVH